LLSDGYHKIIGDHVDAVYYFTQLRGDQEYVIKGRRFDSCYLSFSIYGGEPNGEIVDRVAQNINHTHIEFEEDGSFEIKLTPDPKGKNEFQLDADKRGWGTMDNIYCFGRFRLEQNEYLKIRFTPPDCCYWGLQTWNYLMQSMDYKSYPVSINKGTARSNPDGSFTIYLSHQPMDVDNRISTAGCREAILFCRWLLAEEMP
jgi:hypothetical protein